MSDVFGIVIVQYRGFLYDPADGETLVGEKIAALYAGNWPAPADLAIDEDGVLTFTDEFTTFLTVNPGDLVIGDGGPSLGNNATLENFPSCVLIAPYTPPAPGV